MILADQIREYAFNRYIKPVRHANSVVPYVVSIVSGDIVREMKLVNQTPAVCGALDARKFQNHYGLKLRSRSGPRQGMTARWQFLC